MSSISVRIKSLIDHFANGNNSKFASMVETSEANIRNYIAGRQPKFDVLSSIAIKFDINYEWLLTGKGEMLRKSTSNSNVNINTNTNVGGRNLEVSGDNNAVGNNTIGNNTIGNKTISKQQADNDKVELLNEKIEMLKEKIEMLKDNFEIQKDLVKSLKQALRDCKENK